MNMFAICLVVWVLFGVIALLLVKGSRRHRYNIDLYYAAAFCGPVVAGMLLWEIACELRGK